MITPQSPAPGIPELGRRFISLVVFVGVAFLVLIGRLWQLQIIGGGEKYERSIKNVVRAHTLPPVRGLIKDRNGTVLADNRAAHSVLVTPRSYTEAAHKRLSALLRLQPTRAIELWQRVLAGKKKDPFEPVVFFEDVDRDGLAALEQHEGELPGVNVVGSLHRRYPNATLASHLLGFMNEIGSSELASREKQGYRMGDVIGRSGIERQWESYLRGEAGYEKVVVDAHNKVLTDATSRALIQGPPFVKPVPGSDVVLTIDVELQRATERALRNWPSGSAVVVEVDTGRILAMASKPGLDPNELSGGLTRGAEQLLIADPHRPLIDKSLRENYYPGSTFKIITALAGLEENLIEGREQVMCAGEYALGSTHFRCHGAHKLVDLVSAMTQSCNVYFYKLAEKVGMDRLAKYARDFGFGAPTGLGLNGEVPGFIPTKEFYEKNSREGFRIGFTLNTGIGQGSTKVTVLQMALAYAAVANGGSLMLPQIVQRIETAAGEVVQEFPPRLRRRVQARPESLALLREGLLGVVADPRGTAYANRIAEVEVAGKTGTAQVKKLAKQSELKWEAGKDHAWFASFAPAAAPKIAVVVLIEHGGKGGSVAAPVAMEIYKYYFQHIAPELMTPRVVAGPPDDLMHEDPETVPEGSTDDLPGIPTAPAASSDLIFGH